MDYLTYIKRLEHLSDMIQKGQVSSPKTIAQKFGCCEKTARNMINKLRETGHEIGYCRISKKYFVKK